MRHRDPGMVLSTKCYTISREAQGQRLGVYLKNDYMSGENLLGLPLALNV